MQAKPSVLLVEDDRLTRIVLAEFLKQLGFSGAQSSFLFWCEKFALEFRARLTPRQPFAVDVAENGEVALAKLNKSRRKGHASVGLILTDVFMPKVRRGSPEYLAAHTRCGFRIQTRV
jgi:CheY-like chemotaxis protein